MKTSKHTHTQLSTPQKKNIQHRTTTPWYGSIAWLLQTFPQTMGPTWEPRRLQVGKLNVVLVATTYNIQEIIKIPCVSFIKENPNPLNSRFFGDLIVLEASFLDQKDVFWEEVDHMCRCKQVFLGMTFGRLCSAVQIYSVWSLCFNIKLRLTWLISKALFPQVLLIFQIGWLVSTRPKNMRKSNWIISPVFQGKNQTSCSNHHHLEIFDTPSNMTKTGGLSPYQTGQTSIETNKFNHDL